LYLEEIKIIMGGKKIAFIVVAIATVGVAYYLYNKNKAGIATLNEPVLTRAEIVSKLKESPKTNTISQETAATYQAPSMYDDGGGRGGK
jgi:hypothetical protein